MPIRHVCDCVWCRISFLVYSYCDFVLSIGSFAKDAAPLLIRLVDWAEIIKKKIKQNTTGSMARVVHMQSMLAHTRTHIIHYHHLIMFRYAEKKKTRLLGMREHGWISRSRRPAPVGFFFLFLFAWLFVVVLLLWLNICRVYTIDSYKKRKYHIAGCQSCDFSLTVTMRSFVVSAKKIWTVKPTFRVWTFSIQRYSKPYWTTILPFTCIQPCILTAD